jgi:hypothetical protein
MRNVAKLRRLPSGSGPQPTLEGPPPVENDGSQEYATELPSGENVARRGG